MSQQDMKVHELLAKIERGDIRLPEMQRQYVWQQARARDLLDSLYREYPSGTILIWESPDGGMATRNSAVDQKVGGNDFHVLLDGQQRLTSLFAIIQGEPIQIQGQKRPINILFNLEHPKELQVITDINKNNGTANTDSNETETSSDELLNRFNQMAFVVANQKLTNLPQWVSVTKVFQEESNAPFLKTAGIVSMDDPRYDKYSARLQQLRSIRNYPYRVNILTRDKSYAEITEIFIRVNSLGTKLHSSDLALAQITARWQGSLRVFQEFAEKSQDMGFNMSLGIHLKNLIAFATRQSHFHTVGGLSAKQLKEGWKNAKKGMEFALNFLRSKLAIDNEALLSSPFLLITIAYYGHSRKYLLSSDEERLLRYWVLVANAKARYSRGSTETFLDRDLAAIWRGDAIQGLLQLLHTQVGRLEVEPEDLENRNSRSAYFKTMFLAFRQLGVKDWRDQGIIALKHSGLQHTLQFHHIFPQTVLKKLGVPPARINDICNLSFTSGRTSRKIGNREPAAYLPDIVTALGSSELTKQAIPDDSTLWSAGEYTNFLKKRRELVAARLNEFLGHEIAH